MASGDLLKQLFRGYVRHQDQEVRAAALRIIAEEKQKNHHSLAEQLERILVNGTFALPRETTQTSLEDLPRDRERSTVLVEVRTPRHFLQEMVLSPDIKSSVEGLLREYKRGELLKTHGLRARSKLLFCGPPGCGKTLCAEVFATELGLPLLYVRFDAVVSSYLGETAANLRKVFDYASRGTWVLFFDEFDAIGKSRSDSEEHSELKRVVNSFLQILDGFSSDSLVIAATNHEGLLDSALWRRFDEIVYFNRPTQHQIEMLLGKKLANFPHEALDLVAVAKQLKGLSHSDVERICLDAIRTCIISGWEVVTPAILDQAVSAEKKRLRLTAGALRSQSKASQ